MNIVFLNDNGSVNGGAAKIAISEARAMAAAGHSVHLVCAVGPVERDLLELPNLRVHCLNIMDINDDPQRMRAMAFGWWNPKSYRYLRDLLRSLDGRSTVVHAHSWTRGLSSSALQAASESGCPVVITLHDYLLACPQGTLFLHGSQERCALRPMGARCLLTNCDSRGYHHKLWRTGRKIVQSSISGVPSHVGHYIAISRVSLDLIRPHLPPSATVHNLPNPIDVELHAPADVASNRKFLFAGRLVPEKGGLLFARATAAARVEAQIIGEGMERDAIAAANPNAVLSGWMIHEDVMQSLRSARALVFPSLWYEVLGLTVLEAAAQGVPSIVPKGCAAEESVLDGVTGLHFRSGDELDLRAKIAQLNDPETAARMGKAAYARFWSSPHLSMRTHVLRLEEIYGSMLQSVAPPVHAA